MTLDQMLAVIGSQNDQDRESCRRWMREATAGDLWLVWTKIQRVYHDPVDEVMSRFAQLAFGEMFVEVSKGGQRET